MYHVLIFTVAKDGAFEIATSTIEELESLDPIIFAAVPEYMAKDSMTIEVPDGHLETGRTCSGVRYTISITKPQ